MSKNNKEPVTSGGPEKKSPLLPKMDDCIYGNGIHPYGNYPQRLIMEALLHGKDFDYKDYNDLSPEEKEQHSYATINGVKITNYTSLPNLPGFSIASGENGEGKELVWVLGIGNGYFSNGLVFNFPGVADAINGKKGSVIKGEASLEEFENSVVRAVISRVVKYPEFIEQVPYYIFQKAIDLKIDYVTEILDGYKKRYTEYVLTKGVGYDCSAANKDAMDKVAYFKNIFLKISKQLETMRELGKGEESESGLGV